MSDFFSNLRPCFVPEFDFRGLDPFGESALTQLLNETHHFRAPLVSAARQGAIKAQIDTVYQVSGVAAYTTRPGAGLAEIGTMLLPPSGVAGEDFLEQCRLLAEPYASHEGDLNTQIVAVAHKTGTLILTGMIQITEARGLTKPLTMLCFPEFFMSKARSPAQTDDKRLAYGVRLGASLFQYFACRDRK